tara:strand:- start:306 stop:614 length:309 start_codon:yes stop_codon:yes gene_type:complete
MRYNGYTNKSTWGVALNIGNDERLYKEITATFNARVNWQKPKDLGRLVFITRILIKSYQLDLIESIDFPSVDWEEIAFVCAELSENKIALELCERAEEKNNN